MNNSWIIYALLSAITAGLVAIFGKLGLKGVDTTVATTVRAIIMAIFLLIVVTASGKLGSLHLVIGNSRALTFIIFSGLAGALSWLFYFLALKYGKVSQVMPIDRLSIVFGILLATIFLAEKLSWKIAFGVVLMVIGSILVAI